MRSTLKLLLTLAVAFLLTLAFRALAFTLYTVEGKGLAPQFRAGDRLLVNRWSYGLRTGGESSLFPYGRILKRDISRGDIVAFNDPRDSTGATVLICRCRALPGDTVRMGGSLDVVPGVYNCDKIDYFYLEALGKNNPTDSRIFGYVPENLIIGRVCMVAYNHRGDSTFLNGFDTDRCFLWQ